MATKEMSVEKSDLVFWASGALGMLIVGLSVWWFFKAPTGSTYTKDQWAAYKEAYEVVVEGTLMKLFTLIVGAKVAFAAARTILNKVADK